MGDVDVDEASSGQRTRRRGRYEQKEAGGQEDNEGGWKRCKTAEQQLWRECAREQSSRKMGDHRLR